MDNKPSVVALITARAGSSLKHKNLYPVAGKPLIWYANHTAFNVKCFDRVILSTDSPEIAEVSKKQNIEVPFMRPEEVATATATHFEVVKHALNWIQENENRTYEYAAIVVPTAPCLQHWHWDEAFEQLTREKTDSIISVREIPTKYHPQKALIDMGSEIFITKGRAEGTPRQLLNKAYYGTGGIYIFKTENLRNGTFYGKSVSLYEIDEEYELDINNKEDIDEARDRLCLIKYPSIQENDEREYQKLLEGKTLSD